MTDYSIGVNQVGEAPDYIGGQQDRTAWMKGPIETEGDLTFPFTWTMGRSMFQAGANLVRYPDENFKIESSAHPVVDGAKVNNARLSVQAEENVQTSATVWGIADLSEDSAFPEITKSKLEGHDDLSTISSGDGDDVIRTTWTGFGDKDGIATTSFNNLNLEQIPMWDAVTVWGAPEGMHVVGFDLQIDNRLVRHYTMGDRDGASPNALNATSIVPQQRMIRGTLTWQSDMQGNVAQILSVGIETLKIKLYGPEGTLILLMKNCLWNAQPPRLSVNDRVTVESEFTAMGSNAESLSYNTTPDVSNDTGVFDGLVVDYQLV